MLPDRVSNPGPLTYETGALPIALRGPQTILRYRKNNLSMKLSSSFLAGSTSLQGKGGVCIKAETCYSKYERKTNVFDFAVGLKSI